MYNRGRHEQITEISLLVKYDSNEDIVMALKPGPPLRRPEDNFNPKDVWVCYIGVNRGTSAALKFLRWMSSAY